MNSLQFYYEHIVRSNLLLKVPYTNSMQIIKPKKVTLSIAVKDTVQHLQYMYAPYLLLELISGQRPMLTNAKKSISTFKLREGMKIGTKVTLRGQNMYTFLNHFIHIVLPRDRDFSGFLTTNISNKGNTISLGLKDLLYFIEIENQYETFDFPSPSRKNQFYGMNISMDTNVISKKELFLLLNSLNIPFQDKNKKGLK